jgi:tripartite-type tricarboxylate transporter receptor subunit TctC
MRRRKLLLVGLAAPASAAHGQTAAWPQRPVRIFIGFQAGGTQDTMARLMADRLGHLLRGNFIVENRPGAAGALAAEAVRAATDRHTLLVVSDSYVTTPLVNRNVRYDLARDFTPVAMFAEWTHVVVASAASPYRSLAALVSAARASPGALNYVSSGFGGLQHLIVEVMAGTFGVEFTHVPSRGGAQAMNDLVAGAVSFAVLGTAVVLPLIRDGHIVPLAVTQAHRDPALPDTPTLDEAGMRGFSSTQWSGLVAPPRFPPDLAERISAALAQAAGESAVRERLAGMGIAPAHAGPAALRRRAEAETALWRRVIAERRLRIE